MSDKKLPKLYRAVNLEFYSLRNGLGGSGGVVFDIDTMVQRKARRVPNGGSWKWVVSISKQAAKADYFVDIDQEVLDNIGADMTYCNWE